MIMHKTTPITSIVFVQCTFYHGNLVMIGLKDLLSANNFPIVCQTDNNVSILCHYCHSRYCIFQGRQPQQMSKTDSKFTERRTGVPIVINPTIDKRLEGVSDATTTTMHSVSGNNDRENVHLDGKSSDIPDSNINQIAAMIDDMRHHDMKIRLAAFENLNVIANALGPQRTREELIPYLLEFIDDDDDILSVIAEELGSYDFLKAVGGPQYASTLLPPLQHIACTDESAVREKAVAAIGRLFQRMDQPQLETHAMPLLRDLSNGEWFPSRMSACGLFPLLASRLEQHLGNEMRAMFIKLCGDETPMVRRAACSNLSKFVTVVGALDYAVIRNELFAPLMKLAKDEQDSVRLLTVDCCISFAKVLKVADNVAKLLPVVFSLGADKSWRVRYMVADKFCELCFAIGDENCSDDVIDCFVRLLQDDEQEVRTAASIRVGEIARIIGQAQTVKKLLTPIKSLVKDSSQYTRAALGSVLLSVGSVLKKNDLIDHILPQLLILLKDSNPEVRLNIIAKLNTVNDVLSTENLRQALVPALVDLGIDPKWRIRLALIEHIPTLASQLGVDFFEQKLSALCMDWLNDSVFSIREAACINLTKLTEVFGSGWAEQHILPKVDALSAHNSYLARMTSLVAIREIQRVLPKEVVSSRLLPIILQLSMDSVPNVRFSSMRVLGLMAPQLQPTALKIALEALQNAVQDSDSEISFYSTQAIKALQAVQNGLPVPSVSQPAAPAVLNLPLSTVD